MIGLIRSLIPEEFSSFFAESYVTGAAKWYMPQYQLMINEIAVVAEGMLLDIGTGPGIMPLGIGKVLPSVQIIGIDVSKAMIAIANEKGKESGLTNVFFRIMNGNALDFADNSLDMIISTDALHHWKRPVMVFNEMYRCLKPGKEAWIYDGLFDVSDKDISTYINRAESAFLPHWLFRLMLLIHGFSKKEYNTVVKHMVSQSLFGSCVFEQRGVMMRLRLRKE